MKKIATFINKINVDKYNHFAVFVIAIYYSVGLLSYITTPWPQFYHLFTSNGSLAVVVRGLLTGFICIYCAGLAYLNKTKIKWKWVVVFLYILLFTLLSTFLSPQTYSYFYISSLYKIVNIVKLSSGYSRTFLLFLSSVSDFAIAFCFLFLLPLAFNKRKQLLIFICPIIVLGLIECGYSIVFERSKYVDLINLVNSQYSGYTIDIGATFGNKQDWGSFLTVCFVCSIFAFFVTASAKRQTFILKILLLLCLAIFYLFSLLSLCKTAIGTETILLFLLLMYFTAHCWKKNKTIAMFILFALFVMFSIFILFITVPYFKELPFIGRIINALDVYILKRMNIRTISGRTHIWYVTIQNLRTYNLFFGLSKSGVFIYSRAVIVEGQAGIHNGLAYFFLSYGLLGFSIYLILLAFVIRKIMVFRKYNKKIMFCMVCAFISAIIFMVVENEVFIVSGSIPIFVFNVLVCSYSDFGNGAIKHES